MARTTTQKKTARRKIRTRAKLFGTVERPRVSVRASNTGMYAQFIDDTAGKTIIAGRDASKTGAKLERAAALGKELAEKAQQAGIVRVVFDRGSNTYHGRVKAFAEALRAGGLQV